MQVEANYHRVCTRRHNSLDRSVPQALLIQLMADRLNIGGLGKLYVHLRPSTEIDPIKESVVNHDGNNPGQRQGQGGK